MPDRATRPSPSPRGVRVLDFLSLHGHLVLVAVNSQNRRVGYAEVSPAGDEQRTRADLMTLLDTVDPVPAEARPMRLMRKPPTMSPAVCIAINKLGSARVRVP